MIMSKKKRFIVRLKRLVNRHITLRFFIAKLENIPGVMKLWESHLELLFISLWVLSPS